jgi:hypothetical protein
MLALLISVALALSASSRAVAMDLPYEPNDTLLSAAGPLVSGQPIVATLGSLSDKDFFFFYVAAKDDVQSTLTIENLGGSNQASSELDARILDSSGAYAGGTFVYIRGGESRTSTLPLSPGKYFVEVMTREAYGDSYRLSPGGSKGAFLSYGDIAGRCQQATTAAGQLQRKVARARTKVQRAIGRVRRSRYSSRSARQAARSLRERAKARFTARQHALQAANRGRKPWCFIPQ